MFFSFKKIIIFNTIFIILCNPIFSQKFLYWENIDVDAHIRKDGVLEVTEIQSIHFNGDWNGAYRYYDIGLNERMDFISLERKLNNSESWTQLKEGNLKRVDNYEYNRSDKFIKWRSRFESDPPFRNEVIVYRIKLSYYGVVNRLSDGSYELRHDFAFANRERGEDIKKMTVSLTWDESWESTDNTERLATFKTNSSIPPNRGFEVRKRLDYVGDESDLIAYYEDYSDYRIGVLFIIILFLGITQWWIYKRAVEKGILQKHKQFSSWDEVTNSIGDLLPEEVCLLAEHHEEKIIETWITRLMNDNKLWAGKDTSTGEFKLKKLVPDSEFTEVDQKILKGLFVTDSQEVTAEQLKAHYKAKKTSYSLKTDIIHPFNAMVKKFLNQYKKNLSAWEKAVEKMAYSPYVFMALYIGVMYLVDGWESLFPHGIYYDWGIIPAFLFVLGVVSLGSYGLVERRFGFQDLKSNRKKFFIKIYLGSLLPIFALFAATFWDRFISNQFYTVIMGLFALRGFLFLWQSSPKLLLNQIRITLGMISSANFIRERLQSNDECDVPIGLSSYLPALKLVPVLEERIKRGKNDCLYLLPESIQKLTESGEIQAGFLYSNASRIVSSATIGFSSLALGSSLGGNSLTGGMSDGDSGVTGGGGMFGGGGATTSWDCGMEEFASSASYSPPRSGSGGSSGGGGGGGW
jgi:uncharacterized membrane protein YgcG